MRIRRLGDEIQERQVSFITGPLLGLFQVTRGICWMGGGRAFRADPLLGQSSFRGALALSLSHELCREIWDCGCHARPYVNLEYRRGIVSEQRARGYEVLGPDGGRHRGKMYQVSRVPRFHVESPVMVRFIGILARRIWFSSNNV